MASGDEGVGGAWGLEQAAQTGEACAAMETRQLIVWGLAVTCLRLGHARFLSVVVPTYWDGGVEPALMDDVAAGAAAPEREHSREPAQDPGKPQGHRIRPAADKFPRKFPDGQSAVLKNPAALLHQQQSVKTDRLAVRCSERRIQVEVKRDLMGRGKLISPEELTLGGCPPTEVDHWAHVLAFESELHGCGSTLAMKEHTFIYTFALIYKPRKSDATPIVRSQGALIPVECHYHR